MTKTIRWGMGASAIMLAVAFAAPSSAQQAAPQPPVQGQTPAPQAKPVTPAPKVIQAQKPATPPGSGSGSGPGKDTKAPKKAKSNCNTQYKDEKSCVADTACVWVPAKVDAKTGKEQRKAYCRVKPTPPPAKKGPTPAPKQVTQPPVVPPKAGTTPPAPPAPGPAPAPKAPPAPTK